MMIETEENRRVLLIDDNEAIHHDFHKILGKSPGIESDVDDFAADLFNQSMQHDQSPRFEIDSAFQGLDGVAKVKESVESEQPYMVAFVDMRMPPGIDGVDTIERLWQVDPDVQVVVCTAYSDYSWEDMIDRLPRCRCSGRWWRGRSFPAP